MPPEKILKHNQWKKREHERKMGILGWCTGKRSQKIDTKEEKIRGKKGERMKRKKNEVNCFQNNSMTRFDNVVTQLSSVSKS